jgi:hypothetical protein
MIVLVAAVFEPRRYHITKFHIAECDGAEGIQQTALSLLAENKAGAAIEDGTAVGSSIRLNTPPSPSHRSRQQPFHRDIIGKSKSKRAIDRPGNFGLPLL